MNQAYSTINAIDRKKKYGRIFVPKRRLEISICNHRGRSLLENVNLAKKITR